MWELYQLRPNAATASRQGFRVEPIPRRKCPSVESFDREHLKLCRPVCITHGDAVNWPCMKWTLRSLTERFGSTIVKVRKKPTEIEYQEGKRYQIEEMPFALYMQRIRQGEREALNYYLAVQNLKMVFPELDAEVPLSAYVPRKHHGPYMWIAPRGHYEFCHMDPDDNFLVCCRGRKRVRLWLPSDFECMYPNPLGSLGKTVQFEVNSDCPDVERHPRAAGLTCLEATLQPGEMCFIPAFVLHQVTALDDCISVNVFFGDSSPENTAYLAKILCPPQRAAFAYWICNVIEQNRTLPSFTNLLSYLPRSLAQFAEKQWGELPTDAQVEELVNIVCTRLSIPRGEIAHAPDYFERKHPPQLKIRGLLFRDSKSGGPKTS
ncbi:hypothetical protein CYMTET_21919 [Cymbomonas tetramitiformis]|uniref:JmjC domain-containing protein n=1 Tax=Cymbomonas tetramitiformis TaxID=36881 RepID=A0AAE0G177_9CHLO|nr:hypothetical protein CYMTET_21919 [Cymbomonas tetramitiformis]